MNILYVTFNYPPETGAGSVRTWYNTRALREAGHHVLVLAPLPNYPDGVVFPGWRGAWRRYDEDEHVLWTWIKPSLSPRPWSRVLPYATYNLSGLIGAFGAYLKPPRFDLVVATSPPLPAITFVTALVTLTRTPLVLDLRDIWPDAGILMGQLKPGAMETRLTRLSEKLLLGRARHCVVTAPGDRDNLLQKGLRPSEVSVVFNGADPDLFDPKKRLSSEQRIARYGGKPGFSLIYCGSFNFGMNDTDLLAAAAREIADNRPDYTVYYVGSGQALEDVRQLARGSRNPDAIRFIAPLPHEELAPLVASCDAGFIPRKAARDTGGSIPVKMFEFWSAGVPVVLGADDHANVRPVFDEVEAGRRFQSGSLEGAMAALDELARMAPGERARLGARGREAVLERYTRSAQARSFARIVTDLSDTPPSKSRG